MKIEAGLTYYRELNEAVRSSGDKSIEITNCLGQRYIGDGLADKDITVVGTPGNALGAYLNGARITVEGNAQDATGDTMNDGRIFIHGSSGDATGYAMRGGRIYVRDDAGYRAGIHMKQYKDKIPVLVIGGRAGSFLGEYQAGGYIVVLGLNSNEPSAVDRFCATGMHGGKIFLRCSELPFDLPSQVSARAAGAEDVEEIREYVEEYCSEFGGNADEVLSGGFFVLTPNTGNPYKQIYTHC